MAEKKSGKKDVKVEDAARRARTEARKEKNRQKNDARYRANLAKVEELGLQPATRDVTRTVMKKKGKKVEFKTFTREKKLSPAELLRQHERSLKQKADAHEHAQREEQIDRLEKLVG